jgi:hypothetical protein
MKDFIEEGLGLERNSYGMQSEVVRALLGNSFLDPLVVYGRLAWPLSEIAPLPAEALDPAHWEQRPFAFCAGRPGLTVKERALIDLPVRDCCRLAFVPPGLTFRGLGELAQAAEAKFGRPPIFFGHQNWYNSEPFATETYAERRQSLGLPGGEQGRWVALLDRLVPGSRGHPYTEADLPSSTGYRGPLITELLSVMIGDDLQNQPGVNHRLFTDCYAWCADRTSAGRRLVAGDFDVNGLDVIDYGYLPRSTGRAARGEFPEKI